jgi:hypothetical protein
MLKKGGKKESYILFPLEKLRGLLPKLQEADIILVHTKHSLLRSLIRKVRHEGSIIKGWVMQGYCYVGLRPKKCVLKTYAVHRLVLETFERCCYLSEYEFRCYWSGFGHCYRWPGLKCCLCSTPTSEIQVFDSLR